MVFLILESLGSTELLFILLAALLFFGPRKLPQLSRTLGKHVADFRRASEDFKRTWEREVSLEESNSAGISTYDPTPPEENSILEQENEGRVLEAATIEPVTPEQVIPRQPAAVDALNSSNTSDFVADEAEPLRKREWL